MRRRGPTATYPAHGSRRMNRDTESIPNQTTDIMAILSICFSVGGLILGPLAILGVIFGHLARSRMRNSPEIGGHGLATAGLIVGYVLIGLWVLGVLFLWMILRGLVAA